ncbi:hypothetical protein QFC22_004738 [Naganishia vaughanmartiniae]|uniref:Uncharacterized protein n=1 Tax=Naganishia vaughanmartiniae TaxID=1424756 RepID=A0ACC2WXV8_9TREE|nr:hypothetical protein QFC22_004738 [Naganishia vaughanmartiniae]
MSTCCGKASAALWAFDRTIRFANQTYHSYRSSNDQTILHATVTAFPSNHIRLRIPVALDRIALCGDSSTGIWKIAAGRHVRLTVPSIQFVGDHPFTVMATGKIDSQLGYFDLAIKAQRGFTRKLGLKSASNDDGGNGLTSSVTGIKVKVEGPYGQLPEQVSRDMYVEMMEALRCFDIIKDQLLFLVEERRHRGSGAHGALSIDLHLTYGSALEPGRSEPDDLVGDKNLDLEDAVPTLPHGDSSYDTFVEVRDTETKVTSDTELKLANGGELDSAKKPMKQLPLPVPGFDMSSLSPFITITMYPGRASLLASAHFPTTEMNSRQYLSIVACGPASMCDQARVGAVQTISRDSWKGVKFIEECYSW